jgi:hypothetical protein
VNHTRSRRVNAGLGASGRSRKSERCPTRGVPRAQDEHTSAAPAREAVRVVPWTGEVIVNGTFPQKVRELLKNLLELTTSARQPSNSIDDPRTQLRGFESAICGQSEIGVLTADLRACSIRIADINVSSAPTALHHSFGFCSEFSMNSACHVSSKSIRVFKH